MSGHDPAVRCEMFCTGPIGPDGDPGGDGWKACCPSCLTALTFVCREVMPAVRRQGYWAPTGTQVDEEFAAMRAQDRVRPAAVDLLTSLLGADGAEAIGWGPTRPGADPS